ncbi:MAG TPA: CoA transferase, partial [Candidatus Polarisedimenticolia bacterium]|nr:CoA transferase [Candidatus Polarisedimenticolia bacterium]
ARARNGGAGQRVDVPMLDAFAAYALPDMILPETFQPAEPPPAVGLDIYRTWETADGYVVGIVIEDAQFQGACRALEREDLLEDARYGNLLGRLQHAEALFGLFADEIRKWPTAAFVERAREHGAPFGPVNDLAGFFADPQVRHNHTWEDVEDPESGTLRYLRHPVRYATTPASLRRHPPRLGQHSQSVLEEAGFDERQIQRLRDLRVIS